MNNNCKPKVGLLGLMYGPYEPIFPGITARQERFAQSVADGLKDIADVYFPGAAIGREKIEGIVKKFNDMELDGIIILLLTYCQSSLVVRALESNILPIMLACIQPEQTVRNEWMEIDLTVNQGIHGMQDVANTLTRMGVTCEIIAEDIRNKRFKKFVLDWSKSAQSYQRLKRMRIALMGRLPGMGDIQTDDSAFFRKIGPEIVHENVGNIFRYMNELSQESIDLQYEEDRRIFDVDKNLSEESHKYAVSMYLAFKRFLDEKQFDAFSAHFDIFLEDGRFKQIPFLGISHLMADGYGYAAEGDVTTAALLAAAHILTEGASFIEMYAMDFDRDAIIMSHSGEGNWKTARSDKKIRLIDRVFGEGGLENPPTLLFTPQPGPATVLSLASISGEKFRLVISKGEVLDKSDMKMVEVPYAFFKPENGVRKCVESWLTNGGTHHEVITFGEHTVRWKMLCNMLGVEYVEV